jgi:hypothetical protein
MRLKVRFAKCVSVDRFSADGDDDAAIELTSIMQRRHEPFDFVRLVGR